MHHVLSYSDSYLYCCLAYICEGIFDLRIYVAVTSRTRGIGALQNFSSLFSRVFLINFFGFKSIIICEVQELQRFSVLNLVLGLLNSVRRNSWRRRSKRRSSLWKSGTIYAPYVLYAWRRMIQVWFLQLCDMHVLVCCNNCDYGRLIVGIACREIRLSP